tara:strand:+ start:834 stop:1262 length:429 start_codon:yes stop_codon:yes gene_type:complete
MIKSVAGIIYFKNKYLFQIRDQKPKIWFPGYFGFFGGIIDKNESPLKAIKREILEELNQPILRFKLLLKINLRMKEFRKGRERYYFLLDLEKNFEKKLVINEGAGFKLLPLEKIDLKKMIPWDLTAIYYHQMTLKSKKFILK